MEKVEKPCEWRLTQWSLMYVINMIKQCHRKSRKGIDRDLGSIRCVGWMEKLGRPDAFPEF